MSIPDHTSRVSVAALWTALPKTLKNKTTESPRIAKSPESSCSYLIQTPWLLNTSNVIQTPRMQKQRCSWYSFLPPVLCFWQEVPAAPACSAVCSLPTFPADRTSLSPAEFNPVPYVPAFVLSFTYD